MILNTHGLPCVTGHSTQVSFIQCQTFSKIERRGIATLRRKLSGGFALTFNNLSRALLAVALRCGGGEGTDPPEPQATVRA